MEMLFAIVLDWSIQKNLNQEDVYEFFSIFLDGLLMRGDNPRLIGVLRGILEILADSESA